MTLYLNNGGTRWIETPRSSMTFTLILPDGKQKIRRADFYEQFGHFALTYYRYCGKRYCGFEHESRYPSCSERVIYHVESRRYAK